VALAAVLGAETCEIYTDVDGVYTTDPRVVPRARKIDRISYDEMLEMAGSGANVMHSRSIEFGKKYDVPIHVRGSQTDSAGTMITGFAKGMEDVVVRGATLKEDLATAVFIGVPNRAGMAAKIFNCIAQQNVIVDDIIQNIYDGGQTANIGFTMNATDLAQVRTCSRDLVAELGLVDFEVSQPVSKVSVVGIGMRSHSGVAQKMFETLAASGINIENISTSEIVISCIVKAADGPKALRVLHAAFELDRDPDTRK
jgi:aspartate kinase